MARSTQTPQEKIKSVGGSKEKRAHDEGLFEFDLKNNTAAACLIKQS